MPMTCVQMRLQDAGRLKQAGIQIPASHTVQALRQFLHQLQEDSGQKVWIILRSGPDGQDTPAAVFAMKLLDKVTKRYRLDLYPNRDGPDTDLLDLIADRCMNHQDAYRLDLETGQAEQSWLPTLIRLGWREEGRHRLSRYLPEWQRHEDVMTYSLSRPQQKHVGIALVPFSKGLFTLTGDRNGLTGTGFIRALARSQDRRIQEYAEWMGLLDSQGCIPDRDTLVKRLGRKPFFSLDGTPDPVILAARQAAAYFKGDRTPFTVPLHLEQGSSFQQSVWQQLARIPYGVTRTYEDVASLLHPEAASGARHFSRAVGSACGANPFPLILPCHRVIGKDGKLVGFSGGLDMKEYLLAHEIMGLG